MQHSNSVSNSVNRIPMDQPDLDISVLDEDWDFSRDWDETDLRALGFQTQSFTFDKVF